MEHNNANDTTKSINKEDRKISREKGEEFAKLHNYQFYEISALNNSF